MKIFNAFALVTCLAVPSAFAQTPAAPAADVVGTWNASVTTTQGQTIPSQVKLKKDGEKIIGTIASQMGETPVEAAVKGKTLTIWFNFQGQSGPMAIELAGTVDGDTVKGTMAVAGQPGGEFTATRAKDAAPATVAAPSTASTPSTPSLTGTWSASVELPNMTASPTFVLKQDGEKLSGEYVSAQYGKFPITGTVKGTDVNFSFAMNIEGNGMNVTYTATVDKDGGLKGSVAYGDMMSGTFVATKKK